MSVVHAEDDAIAQLADRQVRARGQDPRAPTSARSADRWWRRRPRGGRCSSPSAPARRCTSCTWPPGRRSRRWPSSARAGLPIYGETLRAYLSFTQDDIWDETPIEVNGKEYAPRRALQQLPDAEVRSRPRHVLGGDHRRPAAGRRRPTTASSTLTDRFETMGTTVDACRPARRRSSCGCRWCTPTAWPAAASAPRAGSSWSSVQPGPADGLWPAKGELARRAPTPTSSSSTPSASGPSTGRTCT